MKVKDLIESLQKLPQDYDIVFVKYVCVGYDGGGGDYRLSQFPINHIEDDNRIVYLS